MSYIDVHKSGLRLMEETEWHKHEDEVAQAKEKHFKNFIDW